MKAFPAQPDNLQTRQAIAMLTSAAMTLLWAIYYLRKPRKPKERQHLRRQLSGVLGEVETVRMAIRE